MLSKFKMKFPALDNDQKENFTVLKGCDDYLGRVSLIQLDSKLFLQTCLISSDFSDACTETGVERLKSSVRSVGDLIGYEHDHVDLIEKLIDLVFLNCYFYTPYGLYRQTKGMPMGDYSSRDALDLDLTRSEFEIMNCFHTLSLKIHLFCRLVDDVSLVTQGPFSEVQKLLKLLSSKYPPQMPLNCQISFGYSRFLDLHIHNMYNSNNDAYYKLLHNLAYKENSSFSYVPANSNIHPRYKHAVVPVYLHRIKTRCSLPEDANHHLNFMHSLLSCRMQDPEQIKFKTRKFFRKEKGKIPKKFSLPPSMKTTTIKFDGFSGRHDFMKSMIRKSFGSRLVILYKSCNNIGSVLCPKRSVIKRLSKMLLQNK